MLEALILGVYYCWSYFYFKYSRDSAVEIATGYLLDVLGVGVRVSVESRNFTSPFCPDGLWGLPRLLSQWYLEFFPRG
jgi:hypothetical protein